MYMHVCSKFITCVYNQERVRELRKKESRRVRERERERERDLYSSVVW